MIRGVNKLNICVFLVISGRFLSIHDAAFWRLKTLDGSASLTVRDGRACLNAYNAESRFYDFHRERCIRAARTISDADQKLINKSWLASRKELARNLFKRPSLKRALFWVNDYFLSYTFISDKWKGNHSQSCHLKIISCVKPSLRLFLLPWWFQWGGKGVIKRQTTDGMLISPKQKTLRCTILN